MVKSASLILSRAGRGLAGRIGDWVKERQGVLDAYEAVGVCVLKEPRYTRRQRCGRSMVVKLKLSGFGGVSHCACDRR